MYRFAVVYIALISFHQALLCQNDHPQTGFEIKTHYAFLVPHHEHMLMLNQQHFPIVQLSFFRQGDFGYYWQKLWRYPQHGLSFVWTPLSSPDYVGTGLAILPFVNFYIIKKQRLSMSFFVGTGPGYISKPFDTRENYKNQAIGSHFNAAMMGQMETKYAFNEFSSFSVGTSLTHFSNGKVKTPNLGINNVGFFAGYNYRFPLKKEVRRQESPVLSENSLWEKNIFLGGSLKQNYPVGGKYYLYSALSFNIKRLYSKKGKFGAGVDIFYDFSDKAHFERKGFSEPAIYYTKPAVYGLYDFRLGRTSVFIHVGTYLYTYRNNQDVGLIYDRAGIQYYFNSRFSAQVALKTHYAKADCIEWSMNISF